MMHAEAWAGVVQTLINGPQGPAEQMPIYIHREEEKLGPYTEMEAQQHLEEGDLLPQDLAWRHGQSGWARFPSFSCPWLFEHPRFTLLHRHRNPGGGTSSGFG